MTVHHTLGHARTARCVDDRRQSIRCWNIHLLQWLSDLDYIVPAWRIAGRCHGQRDFRHAVWNGKAHAVPAITDAIHFADEQKASLAMLQNILRGFSIQRCIQRHAHKPSHPDSKIRHDPVRAILAQQRNLAACGQAQR